MLHLLYPPLGFVPTSGENNPHGLQSSSQSSTSISKHFAPSTKSTNHTQTSSTCLKISSFNSRSIRHIHEISVFLQSTKVNILAASETWLGPSIPDSAMTMPRFQTPFRQDRNENGGGVCIFVHNELPCVHHNDLDNPQIEIMRTDLSASSQTILIGCCYRPPDSPESFYKELEDVLEKIHGFHFPIVLLGDFHAKNKEWFDGDSTNHHGSTLKNLMDHFDMHQLVNEPTHLNNEGKHTSLLDLAFTNAPHLFGAELCLH